jgi:multiple sugar transport system substrate-binding protein
MSRLRWCHVVPVMIVLLVVATAGTAAAGVQSQTKTTKITVLHYASGNVLKYLETVKEQFEATHKGVVVNYEYKPFAQIVQAVIAAAAAKKGPDVIWYNPADTLKLQGAGAIQPLASYLNAWPDRAQLARGAVHKANGQPYTIQLYSNLVALYYNKAILARAGVQPPKTMQELDQALARVKSAGSKGIVFASTPTIGFWTGMPFFRAAGVGIGMGNASAVERVFTRINSWVRSGYASPEMVSFSQSDAMNKWLVGDTAFVVGGNWELTHIRSAAQFGWGVVPIPADSRPADVYLGGEGLSIGAFSNKKKLAWRYIVDGWLTKAAQVPLATDVGNIPVRLDVADDPAIKKDAALAVFVKAAAAGKPQPKTREQVAAQALFGATFSGVVAGQISPAEAASRLYGQTPKLLKPASS